MKIRLAISIYPEKTGYEETINYIKLAAKYGVSKIFTSFIELENDDDGKKRLAEVKKIFSLAKSLKMGVSLDVNPNFYKSFNLPENEIDFFHNIGVTALRLDETLGTGEAESFVSNNPYGLKVEFNASNSTSVLDKAIKKGANVKNILACHNFYPMRYTGLDLIRFVELSTRFCDRGVEVAAFITLPRNQKGVGPWNVNEGMPTLEQQRFMPLVDQAWVLMKTRLISEIIISEQGANESQFIELRELISKFESFENNKEVKIKVEPNDNISKIEEKIIFDNNNQPHSNRTDFNSHFLRSSVPRVYFAKEQIKEKNAGHLLKEGDVIVCNENFGRYKGELHIVLNEIDDRKDKSRNFVGRVSNQDIQLLKFLQNANNIKFKLVNISSFNGH